MRIPPAKLNLVRIGLLAIALLAMIVVLCATASAASSTVYVSGIVKYNGAPVSGVTVTATHGTSPAVSTTTDTSGAYSLTVIYAGDYEDTTITAEYNGISQSPVVGRDELKMSSKITRDFDLVSKATSTPTPTPALKPTPTPAPSENRVYIFPLVDGKATNGIPVTLTYNGNSYTSTSGNADIEDPAIPYSYHGPGVAIFYIPPGSGSGMVYLKVDTSDYFVDTYFTDTMVEPFYKYAEIYPARRTTTTPTPAPRPSVNFDGYVTYDGTPVEGANLIFSYGTITSGTSITTTSGYYGVGCEYYGGPATFRVSYRGVEEVFTTTPTANSTVTHNFTLTSLTPSPSSTPIATPTPGPLVSVSGLVTYNGVPVTHANMSLIYGGFTQTGYSEPDGSYGFVQTYFGGPATVRVSYNGVVSEFNVTPAADVRTTHDFVLEGPAPMTGNATISSNVTVVPAISMNVSATSTPVATPFPGTGLTLLAVLAAVLACYRRK